jgi:hypothetical protein
VKRGVFVDSSAWIALVGADSGRHPAARSVWKGLEEEGRSLFTTDYVLDETYTLLRRSRGGLPLAIAFHDLVTASEVIEVVEVDARLRRDGWALFTRYNDQVLSFTDCVSFAVMRRLELDEAFAFDADFRRVGFRTLPAAW